MGCFSSKPVEPEDTECNYKIRYFNNGKYLDPPTLPGEILEPNKNSPTRREAQRGDWRLVYI